MAQNGKRFLGPNAGTMRDPTTNSKEHGKMRNPPRFMEMGGFSSSGKGIAKNDKKLSSVAGSVS